MRLLFDQNMPGVEHFFADQAELVPFDGRALQPEQLEGADALLVRSVTQVNASLLAQSQLRFVGSATIGLDHIDQELLAQRGIDFAYAPGCNAESVVDYVLASLLSLYQEQGLEFWRKTIAIVGVGQVGSRLAARLQALGIKPLLCDPPRAAREPNFSGCSLDQALAEADILCLHTPLTRQGKHPSYQMLQAPQLAQMPPGAVLINAGRGDVVTESALLAAQAKQGLQWILDVWPNEPRLNPRLLELAFLATPHIAGYSQEGKWRGTWMLYQALARQQGWPAKPLPVPDLAFASLAVQGDSWPQLAAALLALYSPRSDDGRMRKALALVQTDAQRAQAFDALRRHYVPRFEWASYPWRARPGRLAAVVGG